MLSRVAQGELLVKLAQRGFLRPFARIAPSTGERPLPGMRPEIRGAPRQKERRFPRPSSASTSASATAARFNSDACDSSRGKERQSAWSRARRASPKGWLMQTV